MFIKCKFWGPGTVYFHKHFHSFISCDIIGTTLVLLELISVRDGAFCLNQFDDDNEGFDSLIDY